MKKTLSKFKPYFLLHAILFMYSLSAVCSKKASEYEFLSPQFFMFYGIMLVIMLLYAVLWQQVLKKLPLTVAFANKAVTIIWGIIWGIVVFHEKMITLPKAIGAIIIIIGVLLVVTDKNE